MDVGNYTLAELLGRGGTSEVYAGQHRFLGDSVAVKLLRAQDEASREAFVAEAARMREIQHPNIVRMIDFGYDATSASCYLVMDRIDGETLSARLRRGPLDESTLRDLGAAIADGMQAAHDRGIVHRDLKPGNIMLRGDTPIIVDFGIAKSLGASTAAVTERRIGTVAYMAPEQLVDGLITPAVDIWALGVTLYEAASGGLPFNNFQDGRLPQLFESPPRPPVLANAIMRCLERDPGKRPASMAEIARALRSTDDERITVDAGPTRVAPRRRSRMPLLIGSAIVAVATTVYLTQRSTTEPSPSPSASVPVVTPDAAVVAPQPDPVVEKQQPEPKRTKPRPKPRTTSQGETLD